MKTGRGLLLFTSFLIMMFVGCSSFLGKSSGVVIKDISCNTVMTDDGIVSFMEFSDLLDTKQRKVGVEEVTIVIENISSRSMRDFNAFCRAIQRAGLGEVYLKCDGGNLNIGVEQIDGLSFPDSEKLRAEVKSIWLRKEDLLHENSILKIKNSNLEEMLTRLTVNGKSPLEVCCSYDSNLQFLITVLRTYYAIGGRQAFIVFY